LASLARTVGPDGRQRDAEYEAKLNMACAACFATGAGKMVLEYLRSITTNVASGPEISDRALMHLEGQRFLVGLISQRINLGHREKRNVSPQGKEKR
jgi:hypothetical protein